ncbi:MAG: carboxylating nicotinate-nucleotide diphosphorylase [Bacteroidota bacterium]
MNIEALIKEALLEDITDPIGIIPSGDHSSLAIFGHQSFGYAQLLVKEDGILAGVELAKQIFAEVDPTLEMEYLKMDGQPIHKGDIVLKAKGNILSLLRAERLVLNFMQRMSGIATTTAKYVNAVAGTNCKILDTRKTTPNLRAIEKWAVRIGGGHNHRFGLFDMIMLKDNHVDFAGGIANAIKYANEYKLKHQLDVAIEIETRNLEEVKQVLEVGQVKRIMLDNFTPAIVKEAVALIDKKYETEASGGITLDSILAYAQSGVDYISVGALTHSVKSLDLSFKAFING